MKSLPLVARRGALAVLWVVFAFFVLRSLSFGLHEIDFWWQLAIGRLMAEQHVFFRQELLSHTVPGVPWINFEWLAQLLIYAVWKLGGMSGLYYARIALSLLVLTLLGVSISQAGVRGGGLFSLTALGFLVIHFRLLEKPELITLVLLPLFVVLINGARYRPAARQGRLLVFLFIAMIFWVNSHAGFIYGIFLVLLFFVGARLSKENRATIAFLDRLLVLFFTAILINPYGPALATMFVEVLQSGATKIISDYTPTPFDCYRWPFWTLLFLSLGAILLVIRDGRLKRERFWIPVVLLFGYLGTRYMRNMMLLPFVALPFIGRVAAVHWGSRPRTGAAVVLLVVSALMLIPVAGLANYIHRTMPGGVVSPFTPEGACRFVEENGINGVLFSEVDRGGYLTWRLAPQRKIFMDGRYPFQSLQVELNRLWNGVGNDLHGKGYAELFARYGVDYAIVGYSPQSVLRGPSDIVPFPLSIRNLMFPRSDWALVYWDDASLVFLKRISAYQGLISRFEYKVLRPYNLEQMSYLLETKSITPAQVEGELNRHDKLAGPTEKGRLIKILQNPPPIN